MSARPSSPVVAPEEEMAVVLQVLLAVGERSDRAARPSDFMPQRPRPLLLRHLRLLLPLRQLLLLQLLLVGPKRPRSRRWALMIRTRISSDRPRA